MNKRYPDETFVSILDHGLYEKPKTYVGYVWYGVSVVIIIGFTAVMCSVCTQIASYS